MYSVIRKKSWSEINGNFRRFALIGYNLGLSDIDSSMVDDRRVRQILIYRWARVEGRRLAVVRVPEHSEPWGVTSRQLARARR